jgi:hypothetical protein
MAIKNAIIYALCDPVSDEVRYIGKANDPAKRLITHLSDSKRRKTPVYDWINKLKLENSIPTMRVLASSVKDWRELEPLLIKQYIDDGARLLNLAEGGDEPYCSPEIRVMNARKATKARVRNPMAARIYGLKQFLSLNLARGYGSTSAKDKIRQAAFKRPDLFGALLKYV